LKKKEKSKKKSNLEDEDEPQITKMEEDSRPEYQNNSSNNNTNYSNNIQGNYQKSPNMNNINMDENAMKEARDKMSNMSDSEMNFMIDSFRNMDNNTIKNIYNMKGQNLNDDQINMMKMQMNPSMLKMASNYQFGQNTNQTNNKPQPQPPKVEEDNHQHQTACTHNNNQTVTSNQNNKPMNFPQNMDFSSMLKFAQENPEFLKSMMGSQFGGGKDNNAMLGSMNTILWVLGFPQRVKNYCKSTQGMITIFLIIMLIIAYFYR